MANRSRFLVNSKKHILIVSAYLFLLHFSNYTIAQCPSQTICINDGDPEVTIGWDRKDWTTNLGDLSEGYLCTFELEAPNCDCVLIDQISVSIDWNEILNDIDANISTPSVPICYIDQYVNIGICEDTDPFSCPTDDIFQEGSWPFGALTFNNGPNDFSFGRFFSVDLIPRVTSACPNDRDVITQGFYDAQFEVCIEITYKNDIPEDPLDLPDEEEFCFDPEDLFEYDAPNDYEEYEWFDSDGNSVYYSNRRDFEIPFPDVFTLLVTDEAGCTQSDFIEFKAIPKPEISFSLPSPLITCNDNDTINTSVSGILANTNYDYSWESPTGSTISDSQLIPQDTGTYFLTIERKGQSCEFIDSFEVQKIDVSSAQIDSIPVYQRFICTNETLELSAFVTYLDENEYNFEWINELDTTRHSSLTVTSSGKHFLSMQDTLGCPASVDSVLVEVVPFLSAGENNAELVCPSMDFDLADYLTANTGTAGTWIDLTSNTILANSTPDVEGMQGLNEYAYVVNNLAPCENDTAFIQINFPTVLSCDDGDCSNGEEYWDIVICDCSTRNVPDPSSCVDDGDCSNGEESWDASNCACVNINIPDSSTCIDDGDCSNGVESWNSQTCLCETSMEIDGCTDPTALNYNPMATCDDGSCNYNCPDPGTCDDNDCSNGEEVWDGNLCDCITINIPDPASCVDDGDCSNGEELWDISTCTCNNINIPDPTSCIDDGDCTNGIETWNSTTCNCDISAEIDGCTDPAALNFNPMATCEDGSCDYNCPDPGNCDDGICANGEEVWDGNLCDCIAINVPDPSSCIDDGDCSNGEEIWDTSSCTCLNINVPDPNTCIDDGDCSNGIETWNDVTCLCDSSTEIDGCTDPSALNYNPMATCDDGSCNYNCPDPGNCDDGECSNGEEIWDDNLCDCVAINLPDPDNCIDDGDCSNGEESWDASTCLCININIPDPTSCIDDGECSNGEEFWDPETCTCININVPDPDSCIDDDDCTNGIESWNSSTCLCEVSTEVNGCTNPSANNYDALATCEDGTCTWDCSALMLNVGDPCDDGDPNSDNDILDSNCECKGELPPDCNSLIPDVQACDDGIACTINDQEAVLPDGTICEECRGELLDCDNGETTTVPCDDGNESTENDIVVILDCDQSVCISCRGTVRSINIYFPNTMSKDEFGNNEFKILSSAEVLVIDFSIFDRWGNLVHSISNVQSSDPNATWKGRYNGQQVEQGVYLFRIEYETLEGTKVEHGEITYIN